MDIQFIEARDLPEAWFRCIRRVLNKGYEYIIDRGSFAGTKRKEPDLMVVQVTHPGRRPLVPEVPEGFPPPAAMAYVEEEYMPYLTAPFKTDEEDYTYGQDLFPQIPKVIEMYRKSGYETNQAYMAVGDRDSIDLESPQCLRGIDTRIRYGALHFVVYFRSWDLWAGFPTNLAAIQLLKEYMAGEIGVEDGELIAFSKGLHLYGYSLELAKTCVGL